MIIKPKEILDLIPLPYFNMVRSNFAHLTDEQFKTILSETIKFIFVSGTIGHSFMYGNKDIDMCWHEMILETKSYSHLCECIAPGCFVHHTAIPYDHYSDAFSAKALHEEELTFIATYVFNFGDFHVGVLNLWPICLNIMSRTGWNLQELNTFSRELIEMNTKDYSEYDTEIVKLMSEKVLSGEKMSPDDLLIYMDDFGRRNPEASNFLFSAMKNKDGISTYDWIVELYTSMLGPGSARVLDVGCGAGYGLSLFPQDTALCGVDICSDELQNAIKLLSGRAPYLHQGKAQIMPFTSKLFDFIFSNMALMLMNPLEDVLLEINRVLKLGGHFVAVIPAAWPALPDYSLEYSNLNNHLAKSKISIFPYLGFKSGSLENKDTIRKTMGEAFGKSAKVNIDDGIFTLHCSIDSAIRSVQQLYWFDLLPKTSKEELTPLIRSHFESIKDSNGLTKYTRAFCRIHVSKS